MNSDTRRASPLHRLIVSMCSSDVSRFNLFIGVFVPRQIAGDDDDDDTSSGAMRSVPCCDCADPLCHRPEAGDNLPWWVCQFITTIGATTSRHVGVNVPKHQHPQPWLRLVRVRIREGDTADEPASAVNDAALTSWMTAMELGGQLIAHPPLIVRPQSLHRGGASA
jgi:hypothetical protein